MQGGQSGKLRSIDTLAEETLPNLSARPWIRLITSCCPAGVIWANADTAHCSLGDKEKARNCELFGVSVSICGLVPSEIGSGGWI